MGLFVAIPFVPNVPNFEFDNLDEFKTLSDKWFDKYLCDEFIIDLGSTYNGEMYDFAQIVSLDAVDLSEWIDSFEKYSDLAEWEKYGFEYLSEYSCQTLDYCISNAADVCIFEGKIEDYAEQLIEDCYLHEMPELLVNYFDYERFGRDLLLSGDCFEFTAKDNTNIIVTNALEY